MAFIDRVLFRRVDNEISWLKQLRTESDLWFNELTEPLLPLLQRKIDTDDPEVRSKYKDIAHELLKEAFIINSGDKVESIFEEMGDRGLPFTTSREALTPLIVEYLDTGLFLKMIAYGFDPDRAREKWLKFKAARKNLVSEINSQLKKIG